jgi:hypothetical protein
MFIFTSFNEHIRQARCLLPYKDASDFLLTLFITFNSYVMNVWFFNIYTL